MSSTSAENQDDGILENAKKETDTSTHIDEHDEKNDVEDIPASYNPTLENECEDVDLERLKGDAIGDTLYSERFVLNTLLKLDQLTKSLQEEEDVERDLCSLWDMTIEKDVVIYLLEQDVLELFAGVIVTTKDKRLTEILVGIIANMCNVAEARRQLEKLDGTVEVLLELTSCMDSLTLEQLMRLLAVIFVKMEEDQVIKWYDYILKSEKFVENLCYIMSNAANNSLILQTMETLNGILAKFTQLELPPSEGENKRPSFENIFVTTCLIEATTESLISLHKDTTSTDHRDNYEAIPESVYKANQTFCNIHSILSQYSETSREHYKPCNEKMVWCLKEILKPMADDPTVPMWQQYEQDVLESVNDILRVLSDPFDLEMAQYLLKLFFEISLSQENQAKKLSKNHSNDFEDDTDNETSEVDYDILLAIVLNTIYFLIHKADKEMLSQCVSICPRKYAMKLMDSFQQPLETESLKVCYEKLQNILDAKN